LGEPTAQRYDAAKRKKIEHLGESGYLIDHMEPKTNTKVMVKCHGDGSWLNRFDDNEVAIFKMGRSNATAFDAADKRLEPFVFAPYEILDLP
jgi:hypothetical protein